MKFIAPLLLAFPLNLIPLKIVSLSALLLTACTTNQEDSNYPFYKQQLGDKEFIQDTMHNQSAWFTLLSNITKNLNNGNEEWLEIAGQFRAHSDAGASESLNIAVASVLPNRPDMVLQAVDHGFKLERLCRVPFIEPDEQTVKHFIQSSSQKLEKLAGKGNQRAANCLQQLNG